MKKTIILGVLVLAAGLGLWIGRGPYRQWKQERALAQARQFLAQKDYRNAALSAREVLGINSANLEACRIMAKIDEGYKSPQAITWRVQVTKLEPGVMQNWLDLAQTSLLLGNLKQANDAMDGIKPAERETAAFHSMAGMVAMTENHIAVAEAHFAAALKLDPNDKSAQFNKAVLDLQARNPQVVAAACGTLEKLCNDPAYHRNALRCLVLAAIHNHDLTKAQVLSRQLQAETPPIFDDRILHLSVLRQVKSPEAGAYLATLEKEAVEDSQEIGTLASWLVEHDLSGEALQWLLGLPAKTQSEQAVATALAECYSHRGEWAKVQSLLEGRDWGEMDFMRLALLARASRGQQQELAAQAQWHSAVTAAGDRLRPLSMLVRMAESWHWDREEEDAASLLAKRFPSERWALDLLYTLYLAGGNTHGMQWVSASLMEYDATDIVPRNNFAASSLLLRTELAKAGRIAQENYTRAPAEPVIASTYAYALHLQNRTREGLNVLEKLPAAELEQPAVATYYGVLLAAAGQSNRAKHYLDIAERSQLLPEERALVAAARNPPVSLK